MNALRACAIALVVFAAFPANAADVQPFNYTMSAATQELWQVTQHARVRHGWTLEYECTAWFFGWHRVPCGYDRYWCVRIDLGTGEDFPKPMSDFNFVQVQEDGGGRVRFPDPPDYTPRMEHGCDIGPHKDDQGHPYMNVLYQHDWDESYSRVSIYWTVDVTDRTRPDHLELETHAGSGTLAASDLQALPPDAQLRYVAPFVYEDGVPGSGVKRCTGDLVADEPQCVLESPKPGVPVSYTVKVDNPEVLPIMVAQANEASASCSLDAGNANGDRLCATLKNVALTKPPVAFLTAIGEGLSQDGEIVGRFGENVCFSETHLSFAGQEQLTWRRYDAGGNSTTFLPSYDASSGRWCWNGFPIGKNTVVLDVADANGATNAEQSLRVTRGPVGLLHGYLLGEPSDFDQLAARLESEGFETYRMDLRRKIHFRTVGRFPLALGNGDVKTNPQKPGEKYLGRDIEVNPNVISLPDVAIPFPEWLDTFLTWLSKIEIPDWLPFIGGKNLLPEKGFPLGKPASIGPSISLGCMEKSACFMGQFKGSFGLRMPGEPAEDPVTGESTDTRGGLLIRLGLGFSVKLPQGTVLDPTTQSFKHPVSVVGYEVGSLGIDWHNRYWGQQGEIVVAPFVELTSPVFGFKLANGDLWRYQADVKSFVETTLEKSGYHHMTLFGHDMGAIIARMYTSRAPVRDQVQKLLMTGGPQRGSDTTFGVMKATKWLVAWLASYTGPFATFIKYGANVFIDAIYGDAGRMMEPHSTFLQGLNNNYVGNSSFDEPRPGDAMPPDVAVYNYVGRHYVGGLGPTLTHLHTRIPWGGSIFGFDWKLPNTDDFILPWLSLTGDMIVSSPAARVLTGGNVFQTEQHEGSASWHFRLAKDYGDNFANFIRDLEDPYKAPPLIPGTGAVATRQAVRTMALAASDTSPPPDARDIGAFEHEYAQADLRPGESLTLTIAADRTAMAAVFTTQSLGNVKLSVATPHGPKLHGNDPDPGVGVSAVALDAPEAGTYVATATLDPAAPVGALVQLTGAVRTRTFLALTAAGPTKTQSGTDRVPGEDVHVGAVFLQGYSAPESSTVRCGVHSPDGSDHDLPLFDDGKHEDHAANDGFHVGVVWGGLLQREGTYRVTCDALGTFSGEVVKRHAELQLRVRRASDHGIVPGSVRVEPASPAPGTAATISFQVFNHGEKPLEFLPVQVTEREGNGEERTIACKAFAPLAAGATEDASLPWTVSGDGCRTVTVAITGSYAGDEINNDPVASPPYDDNVQRIRVCLAPTPVTMVADAGGPYRYQGSNNKIVLDATASRNTTDATAYGWTIVRASDGAIVATATGRQALVSMPKVTEAIAMLRLTDPNRGTALASTSITFAGSALFADRTPPTAVLVAPATAVVGQPVTLRSESTDDFGPPPIQIFRIPSLIIGDGRLALGRTATVVFPMAGDYEVILDVQDAAGFRASTTSTVHVVENQPTIERVVAPATFEAGADTEIHVQLSGVPRLAGAPVQVSFGVNAAGTRVRTSIAEAATDACGFARVELPGPIMKSDLIVEVLGTASCDPATGACGGGVQVVNPTTGAAVEPVDTLPPNIQIYSPEAGTRVFDACRPIPLSFSASDSGSGVAVGSVRAVLDGVALPLPSDCTSEICAVPIDPAGLRMGVHRLVLSARDVAGNTATLQRDFRLEATLDTLVCRLQSPVCASIAPDGIIESFLAKIDVARAREADGDLKTAANNLAALLLEGRAQSGVHVTSACAEALEEEGLWIIGTRWGQAPRQVYAALGAKLP